MLGRRLNSPNETDDEEDDRQDQQDVDRRAKEMKTEPGEQPKNEKNKSNSPEHHKIIVRDCVAGCLHGGTCFCTSQTFARRGQNGDVRRTALPKDSDLALGKATFSATVSQF